MSRHKELAAQTGVKVYFCDPHSPWQRGTCENTNGLLRQYYPKATDLSAHSHDDLDGVAHSLNARSRARCGLSTPLAVFAHLVAMAQQAPVEIHSFLAGVALHT